MSISLDQPHSVYAEPNVVPMIDVLLVLIIIFMILSAERMALTAVLPVPDSTNSAPGARIVLELPNGGGYLINNRAVKAPLLVKELTAIYAERPGNVLFIDAGRQRKYQEVIAAMDSARTAGVQILSLMPKRP